MNERRVERRLLCSDLINVEVDGAAGAEPAVQTANLEDISTSGACLQLEQPITPGAGICLLLGKHKFRARVCYCVYNQIGYFAGVQFDPGYEWSRKLYKPEHLLDPTRLVSPKPKSDRKSKTK